MKSNPNLFSFILLAPLLVWPRLLAQPVVPNDPMFSQQWHLAKIGATNAWATTTGNSNIVVAVIDTGVDYTHPDLAPNMWRNPGEMGLDANGNDKTTNGIDDDGNGYVDDVYGVNVVDRTGDPMDTGFVSPPGITARNFHGTAAAGIIGAVANNGNGIAGLNWSVQIMAIRTWGNDTRYLEGHSDYPFYSNLLAGFEYVLTMKRRGVNVRVINHSALTLVDGPELQEVMNMLDFEGVLSIFAAGNYAANTDLLPNFPNCINLPSILSIANATQTDTLRPSSCFGPGTVDLAAPGTDILTTDKGGGFQTVTGTSFSSPVVAGAAALLLGVKPDLTVSELKAALFGSVDLVAGFRGKIFTAGRLNVGRAMEYLANPNPPAIITFASPAGRHTLADASIHITFSRPMNRASVEAAMVITPAIHGRFTWTPDDRTVTFFHSFTPFDTTTNYTLRILGTAQDASGATLDGNFNRQREGSPADDFVSAFGFPVANDDFDRATVLTGPTGQSAGNNRYAHWEPNEPGQPRELGDQLHWNTVWYRWTPPAPGGWYTFDLTTGTEFDTLLDTYTGDRIDQLMTVVRNDNYGSRPGSRLSFAAEAGRIYHARIAGKDGLDANKVGNFTLRWYPTPAPVFSGSPFSRASAYPGQTITLSGANFTGATAVLFNGAISSFTNALTNNLDLHIAAVVPPEAISGPITIVTPHGSATTAASFQVLPPPLTIRVINTSEMEIAWAATSAEFVLEMTEELNSASWTPVPQLPVRAKYQSKLTLPVPTGSHFYRLKRN